MKRLRKYMLCVLCMCIPTHTAFASTVKLTDDEKLIKQIETSDYLLYPQYDMFMDWHKIQSLSDKISEIITEQPENASLDEDGKVKSGKSGSTLDKREFQQMVGDLVVNQHAGEIEIPKKAIYPQVDSELISQLKTNKLGTYTTYFKTSNEERTNNLQLAADAINNHVLFPGEQFSFNETVGERTKEKGYMKAPVIVKGELSEGIGGGICQISSTLYNVVDLVGLDIVKRYSHSKSVPYVPPGRDATVSWYGPDFVFENPYQQPILIRTTAEDGKVIINLYSSDSIEIKRKEIPELPS